jgi:SAM-dependent methyltransferase
MSAEQGWQAFLDRFHATQPGITEDVLRRAASDGTDPYGWLAEAVPAGRRSRLVLDVACGSAPMRRALQGACWVGVDRSAAELGRAAADGAGPLVRADAANLPVSAGTVEVVVCSMTLMIIEPLEAALGEAARALRQGGLLVALLPGTSPLTTRDRLRYLRLLVALRRRRFDFPNAAALERPQSLLARHGFAVVSDQRRRFVYPTGDAGLADLLVRSLYLPSVDPARVNRASGVERSWRRGGIGIPLRRLVCRRDATAEPDAVLVGGRGSGGD